MHDLPLQLVAHHLFNLARIGEGQVEHAQGEHLAGQGHVNGRLRGQAGHARAQGLGLSFGQRGLARRHKLLEGRVEPHAAESRVEH